MPSSLTYQNWHDLDLDFWPTQLSDLWPTHLTIKENHLLIKYYLPANFEASRAKFIHCTKYERPTHMYMYIRHEKSNILLFRTRMAAFQGMHVSHAKYTCSQVWLPIKSDFKTDRWTGGWTDRRWSQCAAMLRRPYKKGIKRKYNLSPSDWPYYFSNESGNKALLIFP